MHLYEPGDKNSPHFIGQFRLVLGLAAVGTLLEQMLSSLHVLCAMGSHFGHLLGVLQEFQVTMGHLLDQAQVPEHSLQALFVDLLHSEAVLGEGN